jgi:hypothetical protein
MSKSDFVSAEDSFVNLHNSSVKPDDYDIAQYSRQAEEQRLVNEFADYLNIGEISGNKKGFRPGSVISNKHVIKSDNKIEIVKTDGLHDNHESEPMTVLLYRDEHDEIKSIEVMCSCGKKTTIKLEYVEASNEELYGDA